MNRLEISNNNIPRNDIPPNPSRKITDIIANIAQTLVRGDLLDNVIILKIRIIIYITNLIKSPSFIDENKLLLNTIFNKNPFDDDV